MTRLTRPKIIETVVSRFNLFFFFFLFLPWSHLSNISYHSPFFFFLSFSPSLNKWLLWYCKITLKKKTHTTAKLTIIFFHILKYLTSFLHYKYFKYVFLQYLLNQNFHFISNRYLNTATQQSLETN